MGKRHEKANHESLQEILISKFKSLLVDGEKR